MARAFRPPKIKVPTRLPALRMPRLPDPGAPDQFEEMTLAEHLQEFKVRLIRAGLAVVGGLIIGFIFAGKLLRVIASNVNDGQGLDVKAPTDNLTVYFKVALYIAIAIASPMILYQLIAFLAPGLTNREKRIVYTALPFVAILFVGGAAYAFFFAIPRALQFLSNFGGNIFQKAADAQETVNFYLTLMVGLGLAFQLPLVMFLLAKINIISAQKMRRWRKYSYLIIIVVAAVITPTSDPVNLSLVAVPLVILYEIGILMSRFMVKNTTRGPIPAT